MYNSCLFQVFYPLPCEYLWKLIIITNNFEKYFTFFFDFFGLVFIYSHPEYYEYNEKFYNFLNFFQLQNVAMPWFSK